MRPNIQTLNTQLAGDTGMNTLWILQWQSISTMLPAASSPKCWMRSYLQAGTYCRSRILKCALLRILFHAYILHDVYEQFRVLSITKPSMSTAKSVYFNLQIMCVLITISEVEEGWMHSILADPRTNSTAYLQSNLYVLRAIQFLIFCHSPPLSWMLLITWD